MRAESSIRRFVSDPFARYIIRRSFVIWCASPTLAGMTFWGSFDARDAAELVELWEYNRALSDQHDAVVDASHVRSVHPDGYRHIAGYVRTRTDYAHRVRKQFVVTPPDDVNGAMVAGLATVLRLRVSWRLFGALAWLGNADADRACAEIAPVIDEAMASSQALHAVRAHPRPGAARGDAARRQSRVGPIRALAAARPGDRRHLVPRRGPPRPRARGHDLARRHRPEARGGGAQGRLRVDVSLHVGVSRRHRGAAARLSPRASRLRQKF
jgi:hypothetical protein